MSNVMANGAEIEFRIRGAKTYRHDVMFHIPSRGDLISFETEEDEWKGVWTIDSVLWDSVGFDDGSYGVTMDLTPARGFEDAD